jgi:hypothetical protein
MADASSFALEGTMLRTVEARSLRVPFVSLVAIIVVALPAFAGAQPVTQSGRSVVPLGSEIASLAAASVLEPSLVGTATMFGKPFKFTPARANTSALPSIGAIVGVLENGAVGDETGLPPGRYNIFVKQINGQWKGYAESGGKIVREAIRVIEGGPEGERPTFIEKGWCVRTRSWLARWVYVRVCF